ATSKPMRRLWKFPPRILPLSKCWATACAKRSSFPASRKLQLVRKRAFISNRRRERSARAAGNTCRSAPIPNTPDSARPARKSFGLFQRSKNVGRDVVQIAGGHSPARHYGIERLSLIVDAFRDRPLEQCERIRRFLIGDHRFVA